jgi:hypothetical protein
MRKSIILLVIIIANFLLLSTSVNAQSQDALNDLKQKVMSGQMSQEQAKQEMLRLSDKTGVSVPVSPTMQTNIDRTPKRSLFISPSYMEFSTKQAIDSVELVNISKNLIYWKIDNKSKGISLVKKAEEGKDGLIIKEKDVSYLNGELKAGERIFVSFKMDVTKEKELPEEGLSYLLTFKSSIGDTISSNIVYLPVKKKIETTYFGYDIFNSRYKVDINDIGPSSNEYIIAAGDELTLNTWGQVERTDQLTVAANGTLFIRDVGQIKVAGEKLSDVKIKLINMMSRSCSSLKSTKANPASTFLDISLQKISSFPVYVVGSVKKPGMVRVNSLSTVFSALFASGGVKEEGSLRNI